MYYIKYYVIHQHKAGYIEMRRNMWFWNFKKLYLKAFVFTHIYSDTPK